LSGTSATQVTATIPSGYLATSGIVTVTLGTIAGTTSTTFTIQATSPTVTGIVPNTTFASPSGNSFVVSGFGLSGSNNISATLATLDGASRLTTGSLSLSLVNTSATQITAVVPNGYLATAGTLTLTMSNSAGVTTTTITAQTTSPTITSVVPSVTNATLAAETLTVHGFGFSGLNLSATLATLDNSGVTSSMITLALRNTTATQILADVPSGYLATAGTIRLTVTNSAGSAVTTITIQATSPTITSVNPETLFATTAQQQVVIAGFGFLGAGVNLSGTIATVDNNGMTTGSVSLTLASTSATQVTAIVPIHVLHTSGTRTITLTNTAGAVTTTLTIQTTSPLLSVATPSTIVAGQSSQSITLEGFGFTGVGTNLTATFATVDINGQTTGNISVPLTIESSTRAAVLINAGYRSTVGTLRLTLTNSAGSIARLLPFKRLVPQYRCCHRKVLLHP
jgi:hypothetical protein